MGGNDSVLLLSLSFLAEADIFQYLSIFLYLSLYKLGLLYQTDRFNLLVLLTITLFMAAYV